MIGHGTILEKLKGDAEAGRLHHAQLFVGPAQVGKTTAALSLAVFLQGGEVDVILKKQILEGLEADTVLLLDTGESFGIEDIRRVLLRAGQSHVRPHLVVVIENVGRMKAEAMNALLKTLEEPGEGTVFLLTAHREEDVLPTIISRCHVTRFQTVPEAEMLAGTEGHVQAERLLFFSMGRPGKLRRLMADAEYLAAHEALLLDLTAFLEKPSTAGVFALVRKYEDNPLLPELLDILLSRARTWALAGGAPQVLRGLDFPAILDGIEDSKTALEGHVNTRLTLENLFLSFVS